MNQLKIKDFITSYKNNFEKIHKASGSGLEMTVFLQFQDMSYPFE